MRSRLRDLAVGVLGGRQMKGAIKAAMQRRGYAVVKRERLEYQVRQRMDLIGQIHGLMRTHVLPYLPDTPGQVELLNGLLGTNPVEGMFVLDTLHQCLRGAGGVCEFGVAQGATSALIANELAHHAADRTLWLYDSFEGLPKPTDRDALIDDILNLGSMGSYAGHFAVPRQQVEARLTAVGWPSAKTRIVAGYFTAETPSTDLPEQVCFAYVDFDLYRPIRDALDAIHPRSEVGAKVIVDDYGFFSAGAQTAVDEFISEHGRSWKLHRPPNYAGAFATIERVT